VKNYRFILLDWDGNLARTLDLWLDAFRIVLEKRGLHKTDEEIASSFGAFVATATKWGVTDIQDAMEEADQIAKRTLPEVALYPDALEVLSKLHDRGKKLALISSSSRENILHLLESHRIARYFSAVVAADDVSRHKPDPEPLEKALAALGGTKSEAVIIGDSDKDIGAARYFGIDSILFYPEEHKKFYDFEKLTQLRPTHVVADFKQVLDIT
jgi:pyrophosphatase PpaX